jgi:O-antigen/teichoic acid export membrane protein
VTTGLGLAGALGFVLLGSWVLRTFFGSTEPVSSGVLLMLALSSVVLMIAYTLQPALVALNGDRWAMAGWAGGSVLNGTVALLPFAAVPAAAVGQLLGPVLTAAVLGSALVNRLVRRQAAAEPTTPSAELAQRPAGKHRGKPHVPA